MRDKRRIDEILSIITVIWKKYPELRLCQLIGNCFEPGDLYDIEDADLLKALKETYEITSIE